jgi:hypothetical protein
LLRALTRAGLRPSATTWTQRQELTAGDAAHYDHFGTSVALAGDGRTAQMGATGKNTNTGSRHSPQT